MNREPLLKKALWVTAIGAVIAVLVSAGVPISDELRDAILKLVAALLPIITAIWARGSVTPVEDPRDDEGEPLTPDNYDDY